MKKIVRILVSFFIIFTLLSCNHENVVEINKPWLSGKTSQGISLDCDYKIEYYESFKPSMVVAKAYIREERNYQKVVSIYEEAENHYYGCIEGYKKEYIKFCLYGKEEDQKKYTAFEDASVDLLKWYNEVEHMAYKNSFKEVFYGDMTDEEIEEEIGKEYPERYYELKKTMNKAKADLLLLDKDDENYPHQVDELYSIFVNSSNELSKYESFDNYLDYSYFSEYDRDYKASDTDEFFKGVIDVVIPKFNEVLVNYQNDLNMLSRSDEKIFDNIFEDDAFTNSFSYIEEYKKNMGGEFEESFDNLFKEGGKYFISYEKDGYEGAFQSSYYEFFEKNPFVFYGPNYHNALTVVHEFGHYFADDKGTNKSKCYDLSETQSQGNEFLFLNYLLENKDFSNNLKNLINDYSLYDSLITILYASIVNEVEKKCYTMDNFDSNGLIKAVDELYEEYPLLSKSIFKKSYILDYCRKVLLTAPGYYISYATSLIGALNINKIAQTSFDDAKAAYLMIINYSEDLDEYREIYNYAGLKDPLARETLEYIFK